MERGSEVGARVRTVRAHWLRCSAACVLTLAGMAVVVLSTVGVSGESPAAAAGPAGSWHVEQTYTPTQGGLNVISCATTNDCMAVESGDVVVTTNGGTNWTTENAPAGFGEINAISCPSATMCTVVGYGAPINLPVMAATTNGGMSWTNQNLPPGLIQLPGISCPSTTTCSAVGAWTGAAAPSAEEDAAVITTTNGGANWTSESIPADSEETQWDLLSLDDDLRRCRSCAIPTERVPSVPDLVPRQREFLHVHDERRDNVVWGKWEQPRSRRGRLVPGRVVSLDVRMHGSGRHRRHRRAKGHRRGHSPQRNLHPRHGLRKSQLLSQ